MNTAFAFICTMNYITTECVISTRYINLINIKMMLRLHIHLYCNFHQYLNLQGPPGASRGLHRLPEASKGRPRGFQERSRTSRNLQGPTENFRSLQGPQEPSRGHLEGLQGPSEAFRGLQELSGTSRDVKGN